MEVASFLYMFLCWEPFVCRFSFYDSAALTVLIYASLCLCQQMLLWFSKNICLFGCPPLSCGTWDLLCSLRHVGSSYLTGVEPSLLHRDGKVLATEPPGTWQMLLTWMYLALALPSVVLKLFIHHNSSVLSSQPALQWWWKSSFTNQQGNSQMVIRVVISTKLWEEVTSTDPRARLHGLSRAGFKLCDLGLIAFPLIFPKLALSSIRLELIWYSSEMLPWPLSLKYSILLHPRHPPITLFV